MQVTLSVSQTAQIIKKSPQFVRIGIQRNLLPFGICVKSGTRTNYLISAGKLREWLGMSREEFDSVL